MSTVTQLDSVLKQRPLGLLFDIDGVLSPIVPTPSEARVHPEIRPLLEQLKEHAHVGIITGRALEDGAAMVNVEGLTYTGSHGLEWCDGLPSHYPVQLVPEAQAFAEPGRNLLDMAERELYGLEGIIIERKRVGGSIHYRLNSTPDETRQKILSLLEEPVQQNGMRLSEGKRVIEIRPAIAVNKGRVLRRFAERFGLRGATFAGDDRTDIDAMRELNLLRTEGLVTLAIAVKHAEPVLGLIEQADIAVDEVEGMVELLREFVHLLKHA